MANVTSNTIQETVYQELKRAIMSLYLAPGTIMSTQEIATKLNVSRTPVRESFLRLQAEGLVDSVPQRETMVSRIDMDRVRQERFLRESLELSAVERFIRRAGEDDIRRLEDCVIEQRRMQASDDFEGFIAWDMAFHRLFFEATDEQLGWDILQTYNGHYNRIRLLTVQNRETLESAIVQHERLIGLIRAGEVSQTQAEMRDHVRKLDREAVELQRQYPTYFVGQDNLGVRVGVL